MILSSNVAGKTYYKCPFCTRRMKSRQHMEDHVRIHTGEKPYQCDRCSYASNQVVNWRSHIQKYGKLVPKQCELCDLKFCSLVGLQCHQRETHGVSFSTKTRKPPVSEDMPKLEIMSEFSDRSNENMNEEIVHSDFSESSEDRDISRDSSPQLRIDSVFSVDKRNEVLKKKKRSVTSMGKITANFACHYCGKAHKNRSHLEEHVRVHTGERPFKCDYCSYYAITASSLRTHNKSSFGPSLKCYQCDFTSCTRPILQRHTKNTHRGEATQATGSQPVEFLQDSIKPSEAPVNNKIVSNLKEATIKKESSRLHCDRCSYSTNVQLNMEVHFSHWKNTPVLCCAKCPYTACFRIGLARHVKLAHSTSKNAFLQKRTKQVKIVKEEVIKNIEGPSFMNKDVENLPTYGCAYCVFFSLDKAEVKRHLGSHNGPRPYSCGFCSRRFTTRINVEVHERIHTGVQPYQCTRCGKHFSQKCNLHTHLKSKHGVFTESKRNSKKSSAGKEKGNRRNNTIHAAAKVSKKYRA